MTLSVPDSPGVPAAVARDTLNAAFNDLDSVRTLAAAHPSAIAAVIVEPVVGNMGCVPRGRCFWPGCANSAAAKDLLIFDEVMTVSGLPAGGTEELYGVGRT